MSSKYQSGVHELLKERNETIQKLFEEKEKIKNQSASDLEELKMKVKTITAEKSKVELELTSSKTKQVELQRSIDRKTEEFEEQKLEYIKIEEEKKSIISNLEKKNAEIEEQKRIITNLEKKNGEFEIQKKIISDLEREKEVIEQKEIISNLERKNREYEELKKTLERKYEETLIQLRHQGKRHFRLQSMIRFSFPEEQTRSVKGMKQEELQCNNSSNQLRRNDKRLRDLEEKYNVQKIIIHRKDREIRDQILETEKLKKLLVGEKYPEYIEVSEGEVD